MCIRMNRFQTVTYYVKIISNSLLNKSSTLSVLNTNGNKIAVRFCSTEVIPLENTENKPSELKPAAEFHKSYHGPVVKNRFSFEQYADDSPLIQKFIDLGVNLYQIERNVVKANFLIKLNLEKINPYLVFLRDKGVPSEMLGLFITRNPLIFKEDLDDLEVRINYLRSKKFSADMISQIIIGYPKWLSFPVKEIDEKLGFLQQVFNFTGNEIRQLITQRPHLSNVKKKKIMISVHALKEEMGLDEHMLKKTVLLEPKLLSTDPYQMVAVYEYLIKTMKVSTALILNQPEVLTTKKIQFEERHKFLESLGRAQYNNLLPGYVNILNLLKMTDAEFCKNIAKTSTELYHKFLKTL